MTEDRYRRMLALYPNAFRREYEEEMLAVLMTDSRRGPSQILDLLRGALAARLRHPVTVGDAWARAARVAQLIGALMLFAVAMRRVVLYWLTGVEGDLWTNFDVQVSLRAACWAVALAGAFFGLRTLGAVGALTGLIAEIAASLRYAADTPATVLFAWWLIVAAALVLLAGLIAENTHRPRAVLPAAGAAMIIVLHGVLVPLGLWPFYQSLPLAGRAFAVPESFTLAFVAVVLLVARTVVAQTPEVRRRVLALAVPVVAALGVARLGYAGFIGHNSFHPEATRYLSPYDIILLTLIPAGAFVMAAGLLRRRERKGTWT